MNETLTKDTSKVFFTDFRCRPDEGPADKLKRLIKAAGIGNIDMDGKFVAIKMHFGELGNMSFLRPNYARAVVDVVKGLGGKPFLTDCNTLYPGSRKNAIEHLYCVWENGFTPLTVGCPVIIGDGLKGTDDVDVTVNGGEYVKAAKIGRAVMDADVFISLTHFKGHEMTGFGGAIKNLGMGCGSRAGKMAMHNAGKPNTTDDCVGCGSCQKICAHDAPQLQDNGKMFIDHDKCVGCGRCIGVCPVDAIVSPHDETCEILDGKIAEYTKAVVDGRPHFHITLVNSVSPNCDCHPENDAPIVPDVGMFASFDPVAIDKACCDAVLAQPRLQNTWIDDHGDPSIEDVFTASHPNTNWRGQIDHGVKIGLGTDQYELIRI